MSPKNTDLERASRKRQVQRAVLRNIRESARTRKAPMIIDTTGEIAEQALILAARLLRGRCELTGENPEAVLDELAKHI